MNMRNVLRRLALAVAGLAVAAAFVAAPSAAAFNIFNDSNNPASACKQGSSGSSSVCSTGTGDPLTGQNGIIHKVTLIIARIAAAAAVIMMIVGGFMYVLSGGDASKVTTAKNTLIYAAVGIVIIAIAQTIVIFVVDRI